MGTLQRDDVVLHFQATGSGASRLVEGAEVEATAQSWTASPGAVHRGLRQDDHGSH
jgi:cold shock CspA family protein